MPSLLPKTAEGFADKKYWAEFFQQRGESPFEWYGDFESFGQTLERYLKASDQVLHIGCGNSNLAEQLHDQGYRHVTSLDIIPEVIQKKKAKNSKVRPELSWLSADATQTGFPDAKFSVVLDKGTLDALYPPPPIEAEDESIIDAIYLPEVVQRLFTEVERLLVSGIGRYVTISLAQRHIVQGWCHFFQERGGFMIRVHQCCHPGFSESAFGYNLPVMILVATKLKPGLQLPQVFEFAIANNKQIQRYSSAEGLLTKVLEAQEYHFMCHRCVSSRLNEELHLDFNVDQEFGARFHVVIVDDISAHTGGYAVMIVPQGREDEWLFSTPKGRLTLCRQSAKERLAIVSLGRGHIFKDIDQIKEELNGFIADFTPERTGGRIQYLTVSEDLGFREILERGRSELSGEYLVEDVKKEDQQFYRRLIFTESQNVVQTEVLLDCILDESEGMIRSLNLDKLVSEYHRAMLAPLALAGLSEDPKLNHSKLLCEDGGSGLRVCVVGLGGGAFSVHLGRCLPKARVLSVELDPEMVSIAQRYFGYGTDELREVAMEDGVGFLLRRADQLPPDPHLAHFDVLILDVSGTRASEDGLVAPLPGFLRPDVVNAMSRLIGPTGCLAVNVVTREENAIKRVRDALSQAFPTVLAQRCSEDVNQVFLCLSGHSKQPDKFRKLISDRLKQLPRFFEKDNLEGNPLEERKKGKGKGGKKKRKKEALGGNFNSLRIGD